MQEPHRSRSLEASGQEQSPIARDRSGRLLRAIEGAGGAGLGWLWLLLGWIFSRNLIEGILERTHVFGFDWREDLSVAMVFLHFPMFYLVLFGAVVLLLHLSARRPLGNVVRAVSLAFGVLLVAPIADAILSRGRGFDLNYLTGLGSTLWRFWDPRVPLTEVSPGQRIEIAFACLLAGFYIWTARRKGGPRPTTAPAALGLALLGAAGVYLAAAFAGAWPSWYARWIGGTTTGHTTSPTDAYVQAFRGPGLIPNESRRHAVVMALPLLALLPFLGWRADPRRLHRVVGRLPWSRLVYYAGLAPAGVFLGWALYRDVLPLHGPLGLYGPTDPAAVVVLTCAMLAAVLAAICWNDLADLDVDRINARERPLPSGLLTTEEVTRCGRLSAAAALGLSLCVSYVAFLFVLAELFLAWIYSAPPLRLKRVPLVATGVLGLLSLASLLTGFSLFALEAAPVVLPARLALALFLGVLLGFQAKDLKDSDGDRTHGIVTLATWLPATRARALAAILVSAGYLLVPCLLPYGWPLLAVSALFAGGSILVTLRLRRPDSTLLLLFCGFAVVILGFIARNPEPLRGRAPRSRFEGHADLLHRRQERRAIEGTSPDLAGDSLRARTEASPLEVEAWQQRVESDLARGDWGSARRLASEAAALGLRPAWFLRQSAAARLAGGDRSPDLRREIRAAALLSASPAPLFVLAGDSERLAGRLDAAMELYRLANRIDPDDADGWAGQGEVASAQRRDAEAVESFRRALALRPEDPWIRNNLGVALRDAGRPVEARIQFEEALRLAPAMFEPIYNLALTAEQEGQMTEALAWARRGHALRPGFGPMEEMLRRLEAPGRAPATR